MFLAFFKPVALAFDVYRSAMMQNPIQYGSCNNMVMEYLTHSPWDLFDVKIVDVSRIAWTQAGIGGKIAVETALVAAKCIEAHIRILNYGELYYE